METKLEVVRYLESDVIATSGHYSVAEMSEKSYLLYADVQNDGGFLTVCGWSLYGSSKSAVGGTFTYYDENGVRNEDISLETLVDMTTPGNKPTGKWFHYKDGTYILCNDSNHHNSN